MSILSALICVCKEKKYIYHVKRHSTTNDLCNSVLFLCGLRYTHTHSTSCNYSFFIRISNSLAEFIFNFMLVCSECMCVCVRVNLKIFLIFMVFFSFCVVCSQRFFAWMLQRIVVIFFFKKRVCVCVSPFVHMHTIDDEIYSLKFDRLDSGPQTNIQR